MLAVNAALALSTSLLVGCIAMKPAQTSAPSDAEQPARPTSSQRIEPAAAPVSMPAAADCSSDGVEPDARCPEEILVSAAMSWLGKTAAEFDGTTMVVVEHDPELLLQEAHEDPDFRRMLVDADVGPSDGQLDRDEALAVEARVLAAVEARYAMIP